LNRRDAKNAKKKTEATAATEKKQRKLEPKMNADKTIHLDFLERGFRRGAACCGAQYNAPWKSL
jgi:hypothetical protein